MYVFSDFGARICEQCQLILGGAKAGVYTF